MIRSVTVFVAGRHAGWRFSARYPGNHRSSVALGVAQPGFGRSRKWYLVYSLVTIDYDFGLLKEFKLIKHLRQRFNLSIASDVKFTGRKRS